MRSSDLLFKTLIAVLILSMFSIVSWKLNTTVAALDTQLAVIEASVNYIREAIPPKEERPRGLDPSKQYAVDTSTAPIRGNAEAKVTIVEFADFQCPFCSRVSSTLAQLGLEYGDKVKIAFKHLPLNFHPDSPAAHAAAEAAHLQGKFWEMQDKIFANQSELKPEKFREYAKEIGLDLEKFDKDSTSSEVKSRIDADMQEAIKIGVAGTPSFFINGKFLSGAQPIENFKKLIDEALTKS